MTYKTIVIGCIPKTKKIAVAIERTANEYAQNGWELVDFSVMNFDKAILVFRVPELSAQELDHQKTTAEDFGDIE